MEGNPPSETIVEVTQPIICSICSSELEDSIRCEYCKKSFHKECLIEYLQSFDYKLVICPNCKEPLSYSIISTLSLSTKQIDKILQTKSERCTDSFIRTKCELINRFKLLESLLKKYPEAIDVLLTYRELEELLAEYEQYRAWSEYDSRSVSRVEEAQPEGIEVFDRRIRLVRLVSGEENRSAPPYDDVNLFTILIQAAANERFVFQSNLVLHDSNVKLIHQMMEAIASTRMFKEITLFSFQELMIMKNEDNKSRITMLLLLEALHEKHPLKTIGRCAFCRGVVRLSEASIEHDLACFCDICFAQYCPKCWKPKHEGDCNADDLASVNQLEIETRACPNCGLRIDRMVGTCEHMFCTDCFVGFDWNNSSFITTNFVNPHRDKWLESLGEKKADYIDAIEIHSHELSQALEDTRLVNFYQGTMFEHILKFIHLSKDCSSKYIASLEKKLIVKLILETSKRAKYYQRVYFSSIEAQRILNRFNDRILSTLIAAESTSDNTSLITITHNILKQFIDELSYFFSLIDNNVTLLTILNRNKESVIALKTFAEQMHELERIEAIIGVSSK